MCRMFVCLCVLVVAGLTAAAKCGVGAANDNKDAEPQVVTPLGTIVGSWMETRRGRRFHAYRGVRYAQPPTGALRFQPPMPITRYADKVDARKEGPACPQPVVDPGFVVDEDCLRLNVYTPVVNGQSTNSSARLPVIVFLHPGGFYSVSGRSETAGPHYLMDKDVVLVTINYRLGTLGFLSTGDEHAPGNYGFKDQVLALRWVRDNIAAFGGDEGRVTLAGYSAGALSTGLMMVSPMARGLFHRAIIMSASPISQVVIGTHQRHLAVRQAQLLNCTTDNNKDMVACLRSKSAKEIGDSLDSMFEFGYDPILVWSVVLEPSVPGQERFLEEQPSDVIKAGRAYTVPLVIGQTTDEFFWKAFNVGENSTMLSTMNSEWERIAPISFMLPPRPHTAGQLKQFYFGAESHVIRNNSEDMAALGKLYSDSVIGFAVHRFANLMCRHSKHPVYHYEFAYIGNHSHYEDPSTEKPVGVAHHDDLIYLFSIKAFGLIPLNSKDDVIVERMTNIWYLFAKHGHLRDIDWPPLTPQRRDYARIGDDMTFTHTDLFKERYDVWDRLYPIQY